MGARKQTYYNIRPAVIITAGLIFGILSGYLFLTQNKYFSMLVLFGFLFLGVILTAYYFINKRNLFGFTFLLFLVALIMGAILYLTYTYSNFSSVGSSDFSGTVVEIFNETFENGKYNYSLTVKGNFLDNQNVKAYINLVSENRIFQGSEISFSGYFYLSSSSEFTLSTGCYYIAKVDEKTLQIGNVLGGVDIIKQRLLLALEETAGETYGFNYAIITGSTAYVSDALLSKYQHLGIAHVFAVSGLHVGLTSFALGKFLGLFTDKRGVSFIFITSILFLYVYFCGFTASALRAFIIITVRNFAKILGSKSDATTNVAVSAFIVLCINPTELFGAGFLLSYTVYIGLILLTKPLTNCLSKILPASISNVLSPCLVAQVVSFPLLVDFFGYASLFSFLFNLVIIPFIAFIFPFLLAFYILLALFPTGWIFGVIPNLTFTIIGYVLSFVNTEAFLISGVKFSYSAVFYYAFLYLFAKKFNFSKKTYLILHIITILSFILLFIIINI
jgi:competence protein ComEC